METRRTGPAAADTGAAGPATGYCGRCGGSLAGRDHSPCSAALRLEPPRYCLVCRRRMIVQVTPTGWAATCAEHGTATGGNA